MMKTSFSISNHWIGDAGKPAPPVAAGCAVGFRAALRWRWAVRASTQPREERGGGPGRQTEHQMAPHLGRAAPAPPAPAIAFFEQTVHPFAGAAFLEALGFRRHERQFSPPHGLGSMLGTWPRARLEA